MITVSGCESINKETRKVAYTFTGPTIQGKNHVINLSDISEFRKALKEGKRKTYYFQQAFVVARSNRFSNFISDLFLPYTLALAVKIDSIVGKIFTFVFTLFIDFSTLPIRLLTLIPRVIYNSNKYDNPHPLVEFFKAHLSQEDQSQVIDADYFLKVKRLLDDETEKEVGNEQQLLTNPKVYPDIDIPFLLIEGANEDQEQLSE